MIFLGWLRTFLITFSFYNNLRCERKNLLLFLRVYNQIIYIVSWKK